MVQSSESIFTQLEHMQAAIDAADNTPKSDPLDETLRLAKRVGGANATYLGLTVGIENCSEALAQLELARQAAYAARTQ